MKLYPLFIFLIFAVFSIRMVHATPLHDATKNNDIVKLQQLIPYSNVNITNQYGTTALMLAAGSNHEQALHALLDTEGIDINMYNHLGDTALIWAVRSNHIDCIRALLNMPGIKVNHANHKGMTALRFAKNEQIQELLENYIFKVTRGDKTKSASTR